MNTSRLEAFSDGVLAIIITIMVLGLQTPESAGWNALISINSKLFKLYCQLYLCRYLLE